MHRRLRLAIALMVTLAAGCDNVSWGGADIAVRPPPPPAAADEAAATEANGEISALPEGPVLYYVRRADSASARAVIVPVAEITERGLEPIDAGGDGSFAERLIAERLRQGAEFGLFHRGERVGTFVIESAAAPASAACPPFARGSGFLELRGDAPGVSEFLALEKPYAAGVGQGPAVPLEVTANMRAYAPIRAEGLLRARDAPLPGDWGRAVRQLLAVPVAGHPAPAYATTLLVDDAFEVGFDDEGWSLFYIAAPAARIGYEPVYVDFTRYAEAGKAAPRVVDFLDWDHDRQVELLLRVYGTEGAWFEALDRSDDEWARIFSGRCDAGPSALAEAPDTTGEAVPDTTAGSAAP